MEKYWKLLNIEDGEYSAHETEEEVNHIIEYRTRDFSDDKVIKRINIETPFSNYNFQFVYVFDEHRTHQFLYFFDTIEEEHDDFEERIQILQEQNANLINFLNKKTTALFNANRIIDSLRHKLSECESALEHAECFVTGHKDEAETLKEENERLVLELSKANDTINIQRERINDLQENLNKIRHAAFPF